MSDVDPARAAEAAAAIDRIAALRPEGDLRDEEPNGLTWAIAAFAAGLLERAEAAEAERDRLRTVVKQAADAFGEWWVSDRSESDTNTLTRAMQVLLPEEERHIGSPGPGEEGT